MVVACQDSTTCSLILKATYNEPIRAGSVALGVRTQAVILDLYSRLVIGWAMGHWLSVQLAEQALTMALATRTHWQSSCATRVSAASMPP